VSFGKKPEEGIQLTFQACLQIGNDNMLVKFFYQRTVNFGFTLIEVLVALFIFSLIFVLGGQILVTSLKNASKSQLQSRVKQDGQRVLSLMERELHNSIAPYTCLVPFGSSVATTVQYQTPQRTIAKFDCYMPTDSRQDWQVLWYPGTTPSPSPSPSPSPLRIIAPDVVLTSCGMWCSDDGRTFEIGLTLQDRNSVIAEDAGQTPRPEEKAVYSGRLRVELRNR
jgi:prepilin-type N-terminal cleavage/methylation domain-containing protein